MASAMLSTTNCAFSTETGSRGSSIGGACRSRSQPQLNS